MPAKRELTMRQLRYLLRLHHDGVSAREIGRLLGVARSTIQDNLKRAAAAGLQWPLADDVTDEVLEQRLFGRAAIAAGQRRRVEPDWADLARELKRPGVTMMVLWEEYREAHREGYGYSRFCDLLRGFERRLTPVMRQHHVAGDKAFVDYSGKRIGIFADLAIAHGDARYGRLLRSIARVKLLILDDWGPESLTPDQARDLLEIVEDRYDKGSLVITSQVPVDRWHDMIGVPTLADAILDRIVHNAYRVELAGESLRKRQTSPKSKHS